ncbi:peptidylprolyl isomerase [candidate division KSB1 bacterium]
MNFRKFLYILLTILALTSIFSNCSKSKYPEGLFAELYTNKGLIVLNLEFEKTPLATANFVGLSEGTIDNTAFPAGTPFFDGTVFGRVVPGHVIQAGGPKDGNSRGCGYTFPNEIDPELSHGKAGMLGVANGGPHTNANQWYITLDDRSYLDGDYIVFGNVIEGIEVVFSVVQDDYVDSVKIVRIGSKAESFKPVTETFNQMIETAKETVRIAEENKKKEEAAIIAENWPEAVTLDNGMKYIILNEGSGSKPSDGSVLTVQYEGQFLNGTKFYSTAENGAPAYSDKAEPFEYTVGQTSVNRGFDEALMDMKKGEKRLIILPPELAYRQRGFYGRDVEGQKRFHISPNTTVVYTIELLDIK